MIRQLDSNDVDIFRALRLEALQREPQCFASTAEDFAALSREDLAKRLTDNAIFVLETNGEPAGMMGLMFHGSGKVRHRVVLIMVCLRSQSRGQGLAKALLDAVINHARVQGYRYMDLAVSAENPAAIALYQRAGFQQYGYQVGGLLHDNREIDEILMTRRLNA